MDASRFDRFVQALGTGTPRRGLLGWLLALLLSSPLVAFPREAEAAGRRKRRKKRHKHGQGNGRHRNGKKKQKCKPKSRAKVCAGKCGIVKNRKTCEKRVNCTCPECQLCDVDGTCQPDPATVGDPCGVCGCVAGTICDDGVCQPCDVIFDGDSVSSGLALQDRLASGGALRVCPGRYQNNFELSADVDLLGAGDGEDETTSTILDAAGSGRPLTVGENVTASLQGVRITGGNERLGGGILSDGRLTLTACTVSDNDAMTGGGIYLSFLGTGPLELIDCRVTGNTASNAGGGIHNNSVFTTTLSGCTLSGNQARGGGGIFNNGGVCQITGTEISGNEARDDGGGVYNNSPVTSSDGEMTFDAASRITNNKAGTDGSGTGGGILNDGVVTLGGAAVTGNEPNNCAGEPVAGCVEEP